MTVGQVSAVGKVHGKHGVSRLNGRIVNRHVRAGTTMRLNVGILGTEKFLGAADCQRLSGVNVFAAVVPAFFRITFRVFVGHD